MMRSKIIKPIIFVGIVALFVIFATSNKNISVRSTWPLITFVDRATQPAEDININPSDTVSFFTTLSPIQTPFVIKITVLESGEDIWGNPLILGECYIASKKGLLIIDPSHLGATQSEIAEDWARWHSATKISMYDLNRVYAEIHAKGTVYILSEKGKGIVKECEGMGSISNL